MIRTSCKGRPVRTVEPLDGVSLIGDISEIGLSVNLKNNRDQSISIG